MKGLRFPQHLFSLLVSLALQQAAYPETVNWRCTTDPARWVDKGAITATAWDNDVTSYIAVDTATKYQNIEGFGGCFNEYGWDRLSWLSQAGRDSVMKSLFDSVNGCRFNICRMPIGTNDYSKSFYSLNDNAGDTAMTKFSIEKNRQYLIPFIKEAMKYRPSIKIIGTPWSPPAWLKKNNALSGGQIKTDAVSMRALALYFEKYVKAYQAEGINVFAVGVQNEPVVSSNYPSCLWTGAEMRDFVRFYLGLYFKKDSVKAEIWHGTLNNEPNDNNFYTNFVTTFMNDAGARALISGVAFQWGGVACLDQFKKENPTKRICNTEHDCGNCWWGDWGWGPYIDDHAPNDWRYGDYSFGAMLEWLGRGTNFYCQWNMVLDSTGMSLAAWPQNSMISIMNKDSTVRYNPHFYAVKHISCYVDPGAVLVASSGNYAGLGDAATYHRPGWDKGAFRNPDGSIVLCVRNYSTVDKAVAIRIGNLKIKPTIPKKSFNTFVLPSSTAVAAAPKPRFDTRDPITLKHVREGFSVSLPCSEKLLPIRLTVLDTKGRTIAELYNGFSTGGDVTIRPGKQSGKIGAGAYVTLLRFGNAEKTAVVEF